MIVCRGFADTWPGILGLCLLPNPGLPHPTHQRAHDTPPALAVDHFYLGLMVPQNPNAAREERGGSGSGKASNKATNSSASRPSAPASNPRAQGGISFVAFDAGISKENRKAVRVQAAKASAAARKATIARKLAARKKDGDEADKADAPVDKAAPAPKEPAPPKQKESGSSTSVGPTSQQYVFGHLVRTEPHAVQSPSSISSASSKVWSDASTVNSRPSRPTSPALSHQYVRRCSRQESPKRPCHCPECKHITPASSVESSPKPELQYEMGPCEQIETMRAILHYSVPRPERIGVGRHDPFSCYPVQWQPWYDGLLHYMMVVFAPRAWPVLQITQTQGARWEWFMTQHAMEEPALFFVRLLFASGDLVRIGALGRECSYWLQSQAIKAINEALSEPQRSVSDGLILAVGRIALHECMYGDRNAANTIHRPAQRRMIDLRGGMAKLGFPELVKKLMRWSDRVMSMQGNTKRFLPDEEDQGNTTYGVRQSVDVFETWAPEPGQALRKKIAIADLLTD